LWNHHASHKISSWFVGIFPKIVVAVIKYMITKGWNPKHWDSNFFLLLVCGVLELLPYITRSLNVCHIWIVQDGVGSTEVCHGLSLNYTNV
jgi:hypothetical protein